MPAMGSNNNTPCACCMRAVKWIPVIFIVSIIVWSYYAYVVQLCVYTMESTAEEVILLIFYHLLFAIFLWSYWQTIYTPVGKVPPKWRIADSDIEKLGHAESQIQQKVILEILAKDLPVSNRTISGAVRFCDKCQIIKPDRAHHCSVCGICVLKMDHHCPWVNNCVNFTNYKYFVLFLGYALVYCIYVALTSLQYFIKFWEGELTGGMGRFHILFLFFVAVMFAISLVSLFGYHIYLVLLNRTTLEAFRAPIFRVGGSDKNGYNLGSCRNFKQVFGDDWRLWFLPIYTSSGDGMIYPMQSAHQLSTSYESMGDTPTRLDDSNAKFICNNSINSPDDAVIVNLNLLPITNQNNDASGDNGDRLLNPIQNNENSLMIKRNSSSHHDGGGSTEAWSTPKLNAVDSNIKNPDDNHEQITFR